MSMSGLTAPSAIKATMSSLAEQRRILAAQPLGYLLRDLAGGWATTAAEHLVRLAPWRLPQVAGKKSIRLFGLGGVNAQPVYRCGNVYSQTPCPQGRIVEATDPRTAAQREKQVALAAARDAVLAAEASAAARALGIGDDTGSLELGKSADIVAVRLDEIETQPFYHAISQLVYATGRDKVTDVWVAEPPTTARTAARNTRQRSDTRSRGGMAQ